jgi:uncharacterized protein
MLEPNWREKSKKEQKKFKQFLSKKPNRKDINRLPALHQEAFNKIDCLDCANCCKNHSPRFKTPDIKRIAKHLAMKEGEFTQQYLYLDNENDYVLQSSPCSFLNDDNTCQIYEVRPSDCARYPYTDEDVFLKRKTITLTNTIVCPAAYYVLNKMLND